MSTQAQAIANQANAQKSTGPTSEQGKAVSSLNRRTHGLGGKFVVLPCEDQAQFDVLLAHLDSEYRPGSASEILLLEQMAESRWTRDRALRLQQTTLDPQTGQIADEKKFSLYQRYFITHNNAFHKAMNDLLKQRALKQKMAIGFERETRQQQAHPFNLGIKEMEIITREQRNGVKDLSKMDVRAAVVDQLWASAKKKAA